MLLNFQYIWTGNRDIKTRAILYQICSCDTEYGQISITTITSQYNNRESVTEDILIGTARSGISYQLKDILHMHMLLKCCYK